MVNIPKNSKIGKYFSYIDEYVDKAYEIAKKAKSKGYDPNDFVEMPLAKDISERVEGLVSVAAPQLLGSGVAQRIKELEEKFGKLDWRVSLQIALEVAQEKFCKFKDKKEALEIGVRVGFAYLTLGVVSAPLEGFIGFEIKKRRDGKEYLAMSFAGPIRAAGGTAGAVVVLIGDYVRKMMGYAEYDPDEVELNRYHTELMDYNDRCVRLQYKPSEEETKFLISKIPIEITGDPSEKFEVSNYKDLPRVPTNVIRGGMCLVVGECLIQKAPKVNKRIEDWGEEFGMEQWTFLKDFLDLQKKIKAGTLNKKKEDKDKKENSEKKEEKKPKILPNKKFIQDIVAGRPVFTFPMERGGFRLRYGRNRTSGFASNSMSAQSMRILDDFIAVGTQLKLERPGKATVITACDCLEPPIVKLKDGSVKVLRTEEEAIKYNNEIEKIIHLGDLLIAYGEFSENNHPLVPNGYCEEEWAIEFVEKLKNNSKNNNK
jgi:DNA polymerase II large subunit